MLGRLLKSGCKKGYPATTLASLQLSASKRGDWRCGPDTPYPLAEPKSTQVPFLPPDYFLESGDKDGLEFALAGPGLKSVARLLSAVVHLADNYINRIYNAAVKQPAT